jgi:hypothetical protein
MNGSRPTLTAAVVALLTVLAPSCANDPPPPPPDLAACAAAPSAASLADGDGTATGAGSATGAGTGTTASGTPPQVTFFGDLLPILSSNERGAAYKCTTCHAHYAQPSGLSSVAEVDAIVQAMTDASMPRGGDAVPREKIVLFRQWQLQGFQTGRPQSLPRPSEAARGGPCGP